MIRLFTTLFFRNLKRNFKLQAVTILTFCFSLVLFLVIFHYVHTEFRYNTGFKNYKRTYRLSMQVLARNNFDETIAQNLSFIGHAIMESVPEAEAFTRFTKTNYVKTGTTENNKRVIANDVLMADTAFFNLFDLDFVEGTSFTAAPGDVFLTEAMAEKLGSGREMIGKEITLENRPYIVKGIVSEKKYVDFSFDMVAIQDDNFFEIQDMSYMFLRLRPNVDLPATRKKIQVVFDGLLKGQYNEKVLTLNIVPERLDKIHFSKSLFNSFQPRDESVVTLLFFGSLLLILCSAFNYVNLSVAGSMNRVKEISIKKTLGSSERFLVYQSLVEVLLTVLISLALVVFFFALVSGPLKTYFGLPVPSFEALDAAFLFGSISVLILLTSLAVAIKYIFFSKIIKGSMVIRNAAMPMKRFSGLVVAQLAICLFSVYVTFIVKSQLDLIRDQETGDRYRNMLVVRIPDGESFERSTSFKHQVLELSNVYSASLCSDNSVKGTQSNIEIYRTSNMKQADEFLARELVVDEDYFKTMDINLFQPIHDETARNRKFVISKRVLDLLGDSVKIGSTWMNNGTIVGVGEDFRWTAYRGLEPLVYSLTPGRVNTLIIKFRNTIQKSDFATLQQAWTRAFQVGALNYEYLDDVIARSYQDEFLLGRMVVVAAVLIYFISLIGVFSITSMSTLKRMKEFSIRKIFGAPVSEIALRLSKDLVKAFLIAFVVVAPVVYLLMDRWLSRFALRISISFVLIVAIFLAFTIVSLVLNSLYVNRLLKFNPVDILKGE